MKIFFDVIGCRLNQSEVERLANIFRALGHEIVADPGRADLAVINTCAVTVKAAADSRKKLRRAARAGARRVLATGCWATLFPDEAMALQGVDEVVPNAEKDHIVSQILDISPEEVSELELVRHALLGDRSRTRAFIKVQEGCDNHCTYCLTQVARGKSRSRSQVEVQRDIQAAIAGGAREVVLTGVQLGAWGRDLAEPERLDDLISGVLSMTGVQRVRLSSIEPWDFDLSYLRLWEDRRLCRQLHIPLQSGDDRMLKAMGRPITSSMYAALVQGIREIVPEMALTTDVIAGFPGETEEAFQATRDFIQGIGFAGGHVFSYSPRPGTAAVKMKNQVASQVAKERNAILRQAFSEAGREYRDEFIGQSATVLWESSNSTKEGTWELSGLTDTYIRVFAVSPYGRWNEIDTVNLLEHHPDRPGLTGQISGVL
jgi:threonylcarbamoyladenosine tRNA methylthiotransferase MtaB